MPTDTEMLDWISSNIVEVYADFSSGIPTVKFNYRGGCRTYKATYVRLAISAAMKAERGKSRGE